MACDSCGNAPHQGKIPPHENRDSQANVAHPRERAGIERRARDRRDARIYLSRARRAQTAGSKSPRLPRARVLRALPPQAHRLAAHLLNPTVQGPWIKVEKSLWEDPRIITMASLLSEQLYTELGAYVPVRILWITCAGAVGKIWSVADTHVNNDDILALGPAHIDELTGIKGFCNLMPKEWLQVIDANHVKIPGFHAHNGTTAKKRALDQKRQQRHRNTKASRSRHK
jgi:hypothetical protein